MRCQQCRRVIPRNTRYCPYCGSQQGEPPRRSAAVEDVVAALKYSAMLRQAIGGIQMVIGIVGVIEVLRLNIVVWVTSIALFFGISGFVIGLGNVALSAVRRREAADFTRDPGSMLQYWSVGELPDAALIVIHTLLGCVVGIAVALEEIALRRFIRQSESDLMQTRGGDASEESEASFRNPDDL